jgi:hypothetical protein
MNRANSEVIPRYQLYLKAVLSIISLLIMPGEDVGRKGMLV